MKTYICDRCQKPISGSPIFYQISRYTERNIRTPSNTLDFCFDCALEVECVLYPGTDKEETEVMLNQISRGALD